jgi:hypothetical protein
VYPESEFIDTNAESETIAQSVLHYTEHCDGTAFVDC